MSSGFLSKMFKQEIPTNAIEFDYAVFGMQSFEIHSPFWDDCKRPKGPSWKAKKKDMKHPTTAKNVWCDSK